MDAIPDAVERRREIVRSRYQDASERRAAAERERYQAQIEYERAKEALDAVDFIISMFVQPEEPF
jgi:hypothetical protein